MADLSLGPEPCPVCTGATGSGGGQLVRVVEVGGDQAAEPERPRRVTEVGEAS